METRPDPLLTRDYAAGCYQRCEDGKELPPHTCPQLISEDCLYLSATQTNKPKKKKKKKKIQTIKHIKAPILIHTHTRIHTYTNINNQTNK